MSSNTPPLRFGVIGCGRVVQDLHLPAWRAVPQAQLVAACDADDRALQTMGAVHPAVRLYRDVEALLSARDLDFVVLATPGASHRVIGEQVLRRGLPVLCEKPLALTVGDAEHLFRVADQEGVMLTPIHNYRYKDNARAALALYARRALGDVVCVDLRFRSGSLFDEPKPWMRLERQNRILLFDFAYHTVDLALLFLGPVREVRFVDAEVDHLGLQYVVFGTLHEHGGRGLFELMLDASSLRTELEVLGEQRGVALDFFPDGFRVLPRRDTPIHRGLADARRAVRFAANRLRERREDGTSYRAVPHARAFRAFVEALQRRRANPVSPRSVVQTLSLLSTVSERAYHPPPRCP